MIAGRMKLVLFLLVVVWSGLVFKLGMIQLVEGRYLQDWARREQQCRVVLEPERGNIYDRMHRLLAGSVEVSSVGAFCPAIEDKKHAAQFLSGLGLGKYGRILSLLESGSGFVWVKRSVSEETALRIRRAGMSGITVSKGQRRYYPMGNLAGNLLGFVGEDRIGLEGIEYEFESVLGGSPGWAVLQKVSDNHYPFPDCPQKKAERGKDIILTIDTRVQSICEEELKKTIDRYGARHGVAIVLNPHTGEILALANYPSYNPNSSDKTDARKWKNRAVTDVFEPGSTFKVVADAAALDRSLVALDEIVDSGEGVIEIGGLKIQDVRKHGPLTFSDAVAYSSNVAAVRISNKVGREAVYETARAFGFGNKTGILLPGEAKGHVSSPASWSEIRFANIAIGQGITVTALQLAFAYAAIANGGKLIAPVIVKAVVDSDGRLLQQSCVQKVRRVISEETSAKLRKVLTGVVEYGTGTRAALDGIGVAGKTGTAQKVEPGGGYAHNRVVCSFAGFLPASDPKVAIAVVVDEPKGNHWGSDIAAPLFRGIARKIVEMRPYQSAIYSSLAELQ